MMLSRLLIEKTYGRLFASRFDYFILVLLIPFTFILDIVLIIPEFISLFLYHKIEEGEGDEDDE